MNIGYFKSFSMLFFYRIAIALRESEDLNTEHTMNHPSRHNRRTVVRMQSKKSHLNWIIKSVAWEVRHLLNRDMIWLCTFKKQGTEKIK